MHLRLWGSGGAWRSEEEGGRLVIDDLSPSASNWLRGVALGNNEGEGEGGVGGGDAQSAQSLNKKFIASAYF